MGGLATARTATCTTSASARDAAAATAAHCPADAGSANAATRASAHADHHQPDSDRNRAAGARCAGATDTAPPTPAPPVPAPPAPAPPAPAPAPPPAPAAPARNAEDAYRGELRAYLNSIKRYPNSREARQLRPQGTVRIWIELDRAGQLGGSGVETGSGSLLLDNEALRTVRNGRYPAFPADSFGGQGSHRFVVPIEYSTESTN